MGLSTSDLNTTALGVASRIMQIALLDEMDPELKVKTAQEMKKNGLPIYWRDVPTEACRVIREYRLGYFKKNLFIGAIYGNLIKMGMNKKDAKEIKTAITKESSINRRATEEILRMQDQLFKKSDEFGIQLAENCLGRALRNGDELYLSDIEKGLARNNEYSTVHALEGFQSRMREFIEEGEIFSYAVEGGDTIFVHKDYADDFLKEINEDLNSSH